MKWSKQQQTIFNIIDLGLKQYVKDKVITKEEYLSIIEDLNKYILNYVMV